MHVGQTEESALEFVGQAFVVDAEDVRRRRPRSDITHFFTQLNGNSYFRVQGFASARSRLAPSALVVSGRDGGRCDRRRR